MFYIATGHCNQLQAIGPTDIAKTDDIMAKIAMYETYMAQKPGRQLATSAMSLAIALRGYRSALTDDSIIQAALAAGVSSEVIQSPTYMGQGLARRHMTKRLRAHAALIAYAYEGVRAGLVSYMVESYRSTSMATETFPHLTDVLGSPVVLAKLMGFADAK